MGFRFSWDEDLPARLLGLFSAKIAESDSQKKKSAEAPVVVPMLTEQTMDSGSIASQPNGDGETILPSLDSSEDVGKNLVASATKSDEPNGTLLSDDQSAKPPSMAVSVVSEGQDSKQEEENVDQPAPTSLVVTFPSPQDLQTKTVAQGSNVQANQLGQPMDFDSQPTHSRLMDKKYMEHLAVENAKSLSLRHFQDGNDLKREGIDVPKQSFPSKNDEAKLSEHREPVKMEGIDGHLSALLATASEEETTVGSQSEGSDWDPLLPTEVLDSSTPEQDSYEFATRKFFGFLASSQLHDFTNQSGVMVVGLTRAGKSSAIMVQRGSTLKKEGREFAPVYRTGDPLVSGSSISKTINVGVYDDYESRFKIFDTAGLDENRGEAFKCWVHFSLLTICTLMWNLLATLVVINFQSTFEGTGNANVMRELAQLISTSRGGGISEDYFQNMCFLMTNVQKDDTLFSIIPYVFKLFIGELTQLHTVLKTLENRLGSAGLVMAAKNEASKHLAPDTLTGGFLDIPAFKDQTETVNKLFGKVSRAQRRINREALMQLNDKDEDRKDWMRVTASSRMLQAILQAGPGRLTLSYPDGETLCKRQRASVEKMIGRCATVDHSQLVGMSSGGSSSLRAFGILSHISRKLTAKTEDLCVHGERLLASLSNEWQKVTAIESGWLVYKEERLEQLKKALAFHQSEVRDLNQLILGLKTSTKLVAPPTYIYTINQSATFVEWMFLQSVTYKFTHNGPYEDFSVDGKKIHNYTVLNNDGYTLEIKLEGHPSQALKACVRVKRYEKYTAEARSKIEVWESRIAYIEEDMCRQQAEMQMLKPCLTKEDLMTMVLSQEKRLAELYCKAWEDMKRPVRTTIFHGGEDREVKVSTWEVCLGLRNLFDNLLAKGASAKEMRDSGLKKESKHFCKAMAKVNGLQAKMQANHAARTLTREKDSVETGKDQGAANAFDVYMGPPVEVEATAGVVEDPEGTGTTSDIELVVKTAGLAPAPPSDVATLQHLIWSIEMQDNPFMDPTTAILKQLIANRVDVASEIYKKAYQTVALNKAEISEQVHRCVDPSLIEDLFPALCMKQDPRLSQRLHPEDLIDWLMAQAQTTDDAKGIVTHAFPESVQGITPTPEVAASWKHEKCPSGGAAANVTQAVLKTVESASKYVCKDPTTAILKQLIANRVDVASEIYKKTYKTVALNKAEISEQVHQWVDPSLIEDLFPALHPHLPQRLCPEDMDNANGIVTPPFSGSSAQASSAPPPSITSELSAWLEAKSLSHVASALLKEVGVHSLDEVQMIVKEPECHGMLEKLPPMYAYKLKKAVLDGPL